MDQLMGERENLLGKLGSVGFGEGNNGHFLRSFRWVPKPVPESPNTSQVLDFIELQAEFEAYSLPFGFKLNRSNALIYDPPGEQVRQVRVAV